MTFHCPGPCSLEQRVAAAATIFQNHGAFIRSVIRSQVQDEDLAEDLFQDFFLSLVSEPLPTGLRNVERFLYRAITNDVVDAARRIMKYQAYVRDYAEHLTRTKRQKTPRHVLQEKEETAIVLELIRDRLRCTEAEAVSLRYLNSRRIKEIAERMGIANATAMAYVDSAIDKIRRLSDGLDVQVAE